MLFRSSHRALMLSGIVYLSLTSGLAAQDAAPVQITVQGGATIAGLIDQRTDERRLWLRLEEGSGALWLPIAWERIVKAEYRGEGIELANFQDLAHEIKTTRQASPPSRREPSETPTPVPTPLASLEIDASLANWNADVAADGLNLSLRLRDAAGFETTAAGTLAVQLVAPRIRKYHEAPQSRGYRAEQIERWTLNLSEQQFRAGQASIRLPFRSIHPEFDRRVDSLALVHVRLAIPGQGVFEQSLDGVSIRPFSPVRDALLDNSGRWFLPTESTGRGQGAYPAPRY